MLLNLTVKNWMSYRDETSLSLMGSRERQHMETLAKLPSFRSKKALPVAAIYGGNASGKTGLFKALACLRHMVTHDPGVDRAVPVVPFMLDGASTTDPTLFDVTFLARSVVYRLMVEATRAAVVYECLEVVKENSTTDVYERDANEGTFVLNPGFFSDADHAQYAAKSTRANQLFLQSAVAQNIQDLKVPYDWFARSLEMVGVNSQAWSFATSATEIDGFLDFAGEFLSQLDTGISGLETEGVGLDALPPDDALLTRAANLKPDELITVIVEKSPGDYGFEMMTVRPVNGKPVVEKLRTIHRGVDGQEHIFSLSMESSGTQRLMGLLPMLFDIVNPDGTRGEKVYVVDELDRCFHTMLTSRLIEDFLAGCDAGTRKQLLFTTHDLLLMDQSLMRRDEMFITQRGTDGRSELIGLGEYRDIRFDKDLVRSYLDGRFGGVPMLDAVVAHG